MAVKKTQTKAKKRKPLRRIFDVMMVVASLSRFIQEFIGVIGARTKEAGQSLFFLLVLAFMFASLLTVVWLSLLGMLFAYLTSLYWSGLCAISLIAFINIILLGMIMYLIHREKQSLRTSLRPGVK